MLSAYSATKSAAWSFTNAARIELREKGTQALGLHVGFMDTDMTKGYDLKKTSPQDVASHVLSAIESGKEEVLVDENTRLIKQSLSTERAYHLNVPRLRSGRLRQGARREYAQAKSRPAASGQQAAHGVPLRRKTHSSNAASTPLV